LFEEIGDLRVLDLVVVRLLGESIDRQSTLRKATPSIVRSDMPIETAWHVAELRRELRTFAMLRRLLKTP